MILLCCLTFWPLSLHALSFAVLGFNLVAMTKFYAGLFLGVRMSDAAPADAVRDLNTLLLIIHGDADSQIPLEHAQTIDANADPDSTQLYIVCGADHGFAHGLEGPRYEVRVRQFLKSICVQLCLSKARVAPGNYVNSWLLCSFLCRHSQLSLLGIHLGFFNQCLVLDGRLCASIPTRVST